MLPAKSTAFVGSVYILSIVVGVFATARALGTQPMQVTSTGERVSWLLALVVLLIVSIVLLVQTAQLERDERTATHRECACAAQRNASTMALVFTVSHAAAVVFASLLVASVVTLQQTLTVYAVLALPLHSVLLFASMVSYAPLPRQPPPLK